MLDTVTDRSLVEDSTEPFEDGRIGLRRVLGEVGTHFSGEPNGDFNRVVSGTFEKEDQNLKRNDLMRDTLVDEMCDERGGGNADSLSGVSAYLGSTCSGQRTLSFRLKAFRN